MGRFVLIRDVFDYGKGNVGLKRQQLSVCVGKGETIIAHKKALIVRVQIVLLELTHLKIRISVFLIKGAQAVYRLLVIF